MPINTELVRGLLNWIQTSLLPDTDFYLSSVGNSLKDNNIRCEVLVFSLRKAKASIIASNRQPKRMQWEKVF